MRGIASITQLWFGARVYWKLWHTLHIWRDCGSKIHLSAEFDTLTFWTMEQQGFSFSTAAHLESVL